MNAIPGSSEPRTLFRDSGVGMPPTDSANVDSSKEEVVSEQKETEVCAIDGIARDNEEEEPEEVTYEIRYESAFGTHLHSQTLKRRAHEYEQSTLPQSSVM